MHVKDLIYKVEMENFVFRHWKAPGNSVYMTYWRALQNPRPASKVRVIRASKCYQSNSSSSASRVGFAGLGAMGCGMAINLVKSGFHVTGFDPSPQARKAFEAGGGLAATSIEESCRGTNRSDDNKLGPRIFEAHPIVSERESITFVHSPALDLLHPSLQLTF